MLCLLHSHLLLLWHPRGREVWRSTQKEALLGSAAATPLWTMLAFTNMLPGLMMQR